VIDLIYDMDAIAGVSDLVKSVMYVDVSNQDAVLYNKSHLAVLGSVHVAKPCETLFRANLAAVKDRFQGDVAE
jgi:hypothetical protein